MAEDTVTIRAEMLSDIPAKAAESAAALKGMTAEARDGGTAMATGMTSASKAVDEVAVKTTKAADGHSKLSKAMKDVTEQGKKVRETVVGMGEAITERLSYPMMQLTWMLEGAAAGMVAFGIATYSQLQQVNLQLTMFTGNAQAGAQAMQQLMSLRNPASLGTLSGGWEQLVEGGASRGQATQLMRALAGAGAVSGNANGLIPGATGALSNILASGGKITGSEASALQAVFPQFFNLLAGDYGGRYGSGVHLRGGMEIYGQTVQMPSNLLSQLEHTPQARRGLGMYQHTLAGEFGQMKVSVGELLSVLETPLATALGGAMTRIDTWATGVESRFKRMSGRLAADLSSGNIDSFSHTLAYVLGDPHLAGAIQTVTKDLESMARIFTGDVIPVAKDVMAVVAPAFKALSDILDFMAAHRALTQALIVTLGGFVVVSKLGQWFLTAATAVRTFREAVEAKGLASALWNLSRGMLGWNTAAAGGSAAGGTAAAAGSGTAAASAGGAAATTVGGAIQALALPVAGFLAVRAIAGLDQSALHRHLAGFHNVTVGQHLSNIAMMRFGLQTNPNTGALAPGYHHHTVVQGNVNISIPGSGNPEKVANAIPRNINDQIRGYNLHQARRTATTANPAGVNASTSSLGVG